MSKLKDSNKLPVPRKAQLQVLTDRRANDEVLDWFEKVCNKVGSTNFRLHCKLALIEGFTNAVRHAHHELPPSTPIDIEVSIFPERIEIRIWNCGPPFDLNEWFKQHPPQKDIYAGHGRGNWLMHNIADELSYTRTSDNRNCLLIVKNYDSIFEEEK